MMRLERRQQARQHVERRLFIRLLDLDDLKAAAQRGVVLEILLVLGPGGGRDRAQVAARQRRLQQVGGVALARPGPPAPIIVCASSMNRMIGRGEACDLVDHRFEPILELALDAGAGLQEPQIEGAQRHVLAGAAAPAL